MEFAISSTIVPEHSKYYINVVINIVGSKDEIKCKWKEPYKTEQEADANLNNVLDLVSEIISNLEIINHKKGHLTYPKATGTNLFYSSKKE